MNFLSRVLLSIILLSNVCFAYHLGGTEPMCWMTDLSTKVQVLLSECPSTLDSEWVTGYNPPTSFQIHDTAPTVKWRVIISLPDLVNRSGHLLQDGDVSIPHANLHSCISDIPFCTPSVQVTPGLNTQTPAQTGLLLNGVAVFEAPLLIGLNNASTRTTWTVLAHTRVYQWPNQTGPILQWDIAIGQPSTVLLDPTFDERSEAMYVVLYVVASLELVLIFLTMALLVWYRNHVIIHVSSNAFLMLMCFFAALGVSAVYVYGLSPATTGSCVISMWFAGIGFAGLFGCLLSKTFRLWRMFNSRSLKPQLITNTMVLGYVLLVVAPEAIIFIIWSAADTPHPQRNYNADISYTVECHSDINSLWIALISAYQLIILFAGCALCYLTRRLTTLFRESTFIGYATILMLGAAILAPVQFTEGTSPDAIYILQSIQVLLYGPVVFLICWPKFFRIFRGDNPDLRAFLTRRSSGSHMSNASLNSTSTADPDIELEEEMGSLFKDGRLRANVAKRIHNLGVEATTIQTMIDAADPITEDDLRDFLIAFNALRRHLPN